jgi:hypothetical protein
MHYVAWWPKLQDLLSNDKLIYMCTAKTGQNKLTLLVHFSSDQNSYKHFPYI